MKKILALLLAIIMILALCGCGEEAKAPEPTPEPDVDGALQGVFITDQADAEYMALYFSDGTVESTVIGSDGMITSGIGSYEINISESTITCTFRSFREGAVFQKDKQAVLRFSLDENGEISLTLGETPFTHTTDAFRRFRYVLVEKVDGEFTYNYQYDSNGRLIDNTYYQYTYNEDSTIATRTYLGSVTSYVYDANGIRVMAKGEDGAFTTYEYDAAGHLIMEKYTGAKDGYFKSALTQYQLDANGFPSKKIIDYEYPSGKTSTSVYEYVNDTLGNVLVMTNEYGRTWVYEYDEEGLPMSCTHDNTVVDYTYGWIELTGEDCTFVNKALY